MFVFVSCSCSLSDETNVFQMMPMDTESQEEVGYWWEQVEHFYLWHSHGTLAMTVLVDLSIEATGTEESYMLAHQPQCSRQGIPCLIPFLIDVLFQRLIILEYLVCIISVSV